MKYKKIISIFLILVILFNVLTINIYASSWWDNKVIRWAFVVFASTLNAYNVVASVVNARALFENWWYGLSAYDREDFYNNTKSLFNLGVLDTAMIGYGINKWIKENMKSGFGSIYEESDFITDNIRYEVYNGRNYVTNLEIRKVDNKIKCILFFNGEEVGYTYIVTINVKSLNSSKVIDYQIDPVSPSTGRSRFRYDYILEYTNTTNEVITKKSNGFTAWQGTTKALYDESNYNESLYNDYMEYIDEESKPNYIGSYFAGEAVDYPMDEYPEDKPVILPAPNFDNPDMGYDDAGNKVFDGTVEQFLDDALDNNVYYDKLIDNILDGSLSGAGSTSNVNVNTNDGTITWPKTSVVDYPDTVIDYPDITVPDTVEEGVGEQTSILKGIGDFIENIFAAPSVELDLLPLSNVNLKEKFPFCLPFDLSRLITGLNSKDKKAPEIDFKFKVYNEEYSIPINFEIFNNIAIIVNWFVLIIFIIGLILISRKLIGG